MALAGTGKAGRDRSAFFVRSHFRSHLPSLPRRRPGSRAGCVALDDLWIPAFAGKEREDGYKISYHANMNARLVQPCVYLLASGRNGTLYCGSTGDLIKRVWEHRQGAGSHFTTKYAVHALVWFEPHDVMDSAIQREHRIKRWKLRLIEESNPAWADLYEGLM